jgi:proteic killer suppression protein
LKRLFENADRSGIRPDLVEKVERILARLDTVASAAEMDVPGFGLHRLSGELKGFWAVTVSRNWRVIFRIEDGDAYDVDFVDYH